MTTERQRLIELALESLKNRKKQIEMEIAHLSRELRSQPGAGISSRRLNRPATAGVPGRRRSRFSKEERLRRSLRMKARWENWRKQRNRQK